MINRKSNKSTDQLQKEIDKLNLQLEKLKRESAPIRNEELVESEIKYSAVYNSMSDGFAIHELVTDQTGKAIDYIITDVNPAFEKITGLKKNMILGRMATEVYSTIEAPYLEIYSRVATTGVPEVFESYFQSMGIHFHISVFSPGKGKFATVFQNISERKIISNTQDFLLRKSFAISGEEFFESLARFLANELRMDYVCIDKLEVDMLTATTVAIYHNGNFEPNISHTLKETPGGVVVGKTTCCFPNNVCNMFPNDSALQELEAESYIGTTLWSFDGKPIGLIAVIGSEPLATAHIAEIILKLVSIRAAGELERKKREELLRKNEIHFKALIENVNSGVALIDKTGSFSLFNNTFLKLFGLQEGSSVKNVNDQDWSLWSVFDVNGRSISVNDHPVRKAALQGIHVKDQMVGVLVPSARELTWMLISAEPIQDNNGQIENVICTYYNITDLKKADDNLKANEMKLWSVLDATLESVYMFDRNGIICMSNSTGIERLNCKSENEVVGHYFSEFMSPGIAKLRQEKMDEVFARGIPLEFIDEQECRTYHHNFFPVFKDNIVEYVVTYTSDITDRRKSEAKLIESEDRFRTIAESLPVMITIIRICDSAITFTNEPFEYTFGLKKDELTGKKFYDTFHSHKEYAKIRKILREEGQINNREVQVMRSDGYPFWIMLSVRKINFMNESSYLLVSLDITELKKAQMELLRLNRVLNAHSKSSQAMMHSFNELNYINEVCKIIMEDCGHSMVWVGYAMNDENKSVKPIAYSGFEKGYIEQLNISWADTARGRGPTGVAIRTGKFSLCRNMQTDPAFEPWKEAAIRNGYAASIVLPLISDGKPFGAISIYSKEPDPFSEAEIDLLSDLADDLAYGISYIRITDAEREATRGIKENETKLKELIVTKDKFFNIVAHDLKNPFTSLLGSSELLYDNIGEMTQDNVRKLALILNDSAKGGYAILQNLLDWSRSQTGLLKFNPEKINIRNIIDENIDNLQLQTTNKEIKMFSRLKDDLIIYADKNMINTVLRNLLSNAVKYTFKGGSIIVMTENNKKAVTVTVKDSGIGIKKEYMDTLFRLDNSLSLPGTEKEQGTGLGLKLCKEFTQKMGGKIWVKSIFGEGSEFKFTIPFNASKATP